MRAGYWNRTNRPRWRAELADEGLRRPFDRNSIPNYLAHSTQTEGTGKEVDRGATNGSNARFSERVCQSVRQSPRLHGPVLPASSTERPSLLLPPYGTRLGGPPPPERENHLRSHRGKDHDWSVRHQPSQPTLQVGRNRRGLQERNGRSDQASISPKRRP